MDDTPTPEPAEIAAELASAGFVDAQEIGRGGFGVVYRCHQTSLGRSVAVKVLGSEFDQVNRERFLREGCAMGGLSGHPNIAHVLQVGVTPSNRLFIVMPYFAADSLAQRLRQTGPIPWPEALQIGVKLCGALETAHRTRTLHRDIKPDNVLLNDYGEPVLSDFGLAHISGGFKTASSRLYTPTSPRGCDDGDHSSAPLLIPRFDHHAVADDDCNVAVPDHEVAGQQRTLVQPRLRHSSRCGTLRAEGGVVTVSG